MKTKLFIAALGFLALATAACSPPATSTGTTPSASEKMGDTNVSATTQAAGMIQSTGVVTQVDAAAGTVTFDHQAIAAINWPAMTMQFHAENPAILHGVAVGDHVAFELKSASEPSIVTRVQKQ